MYQIDFIMKILNYMKLIYEHVRLTPNGLKRNRLLIKINIDYR